jgi:hypothetical protein
MFNTLHCGFAFDFRGIGGPRCLAVHLVGDKGELVGTLEQDVESGFELEDGFEDRAPAEDVEAETGAGEGDGEAADVAEVTDAAGAD